MGRAPCCDKASVKKGPWSSEEDAKLKSYIDQHGTGGNWIALPQKIGMKRCGKSCRLRWLNYLRPNIKHGDFTEEEDQIICNLYISIGSRWSLIAAQLPGRTDNDIKNYWNTKLKKKLLGNCRRDHDQSRRASSFNDPANSQILSSSALERIQLHLQLQSMNNNNHPFTSFYDNPLLWPKFHSIRNDIVLDQNLGGHGYFPSNYNNSMQNQRKTEEEFCSFSKDFSSNNNPNDDDASLLADYLLKEFDGAEKENSTSMNCWWNKSSEISLLDQEKSSTSTSWEHSVSALQQQPDDELIFSNEYGLMSYDI